MKNKQKDSLFKMKVKIHCAGKESLNLVTNGKVHFASFKKIYPRSKGLVCVKSQRTIEILFNNANNLQLLPDIHSYSVIFQQGMLIL